MKKTIAVLSVLLSTGVFALGNMSTTNTEVKNNNGHMMNQKQNLTETQQIEFNSLHQKQMKENQKLKLDIKEINLKMEKEMLSNTPNQATLNKLITDKSKIVAQREKNNLAFKLKMKEDFNIEMRGMKHSGMRGHNNSNHSGKTQNHNGQHNQNHNNMNK